jgi:hypothetical protein
MECERQPSSKTGSPSLDHSSSLLARRPNPLVGKTESVTVP